jgi:hypothetical protein
LLIQVSKPLLPSGFAFPAVFSLGRFHCLPLHVRRLVAAADAQRLYVIDDPSGATAMTFAGGRAWMLLLELGASPVRSLLFAYGRPNEGQSEARG